MTLTAETTGLPNAVLRVRQASPLFWWASIAFALAFALCAILPLADHRLINGANVWAKPAKFYLSLAVQMITLAWGLSLLDSDRRQSILLRAMPVLFVALAAMEMVYVTFRAARGEASHFNVSSQLAQLLYSLMGLGAVSMMLITAVVGVTMIRHGRPRSLARLSGLSFIIAAALTIAVGGYLGASQSHWIGGDQTDATGLPILGWSTTGGDLRPAHFSAMHIMQIVPLTVTAVGVRSGVTAGALSIAATVLLFLQAILGYPLITF